jgi:hypothetical protein
MRKIKPNVKNGVWVDKNGNLAILNGVAQKDLKQDEELFWYGEYVMGIDFSKGKDKTIIDGEIIE